MQNKLRMSTMLRLFFILVVILPVILMSTVMLNIYKNDILQQNTARSLQTAQSVAYSVSQEINRMVGLFASIGVDQDIIAAAMDVHNLTGINKQLASNNLKVLIEKYTASVSGRVLSVNFIFDNGRIYSYMKNLTMSASSIREQNWYRPTKEASDVVQFIGMLPNALHGNYNPYMMTAALSPSEMNASSKLDIVLFSFESSAFDPILQSRSNSESIIHIVSNKGEIVASNTIVERGSLISASWLEAIGHSNRGSFVDRESNDSDSLITYAKVEKNDWYIVQTIPYDDLLANYNQVYSIVWLLALLIIVAFVVISFYFVSNFTRPIRELLRQMIRVTGGDLNTKHTVSGSLEMAKLGHSFNVMTGQVRELLDRHEKQEIEKRKVEFEALQSQINPHFLINTLNAIKYMALVSKADHIRKMTHALTQLLASSFNRGGLLTTVEQEVDHLKHYLYIMEIRFGRPIQTEWHISEGTSRLYLLKLLLQPILENSIIHGLKEIEEQGEICLSIDKEGGDLLVGIADNGVGMPISDHVIEEASGGRYTFNGMGNSNVHRRIQLHYGERYGLEVGPNHPRGTRVQLRLPIIDKPDEDNQDER